MKSILRHIGAISLASLVLFSTLSFTIGLHYCGKRLVEVAVNNETHGCGMEMAPKNGSDTWSQAGIPCCEDVNLAFEGQDDLRHSGPEISFVKLFAIVQPHHISVLPRVDIIKRTFNYLEYSPPLLIRDLPVLNRAFLI
jgi:hypothetical protein